MDDLDHISHLAYAYLSAKEEVVRAGYGWEIFWQEHLSFEDINEQTFMKECAWVILNAGMRESVIRRLFPRISTSFMAWIGATEISARRDDCITSALRVFNHPMKINAIGDIVQEVSNLGFAEVKERIHDRGVEYLRTLPFIGPVTSYHLGKNLGINLAKPDRHLDRVAQITGYSHPTQLCDAIASATGDKVSVVDVVIWRYATLHSDYLKLFTIPLRSSSYGEDPLGLTKFVEPSLNTREHECCLLHRCSLQTERATLLQSS